MRKKRSCFYGQKRETGFGGLSGLFDGCRFSTGCEAHREDLQVYYFNASRVQVNWFLVQFIKKAVNVVTPLYT